MQDITYEKFLTHLYRDLPLDSIFPIIEANSHKLFDAFQNLKISHIAIEQFNNLYAVNIITKDMNFVVDSIINYWKNIDCEVIFTNVTNCSVKRDINNRLISFDFVNYIKNNTEIIITFIVKPHLLFDQKLITTEINKILYHVQITNDDWVTIKNLTSNLTLYLDDNSEEEVEFLNWLLNNNFIFLACCEGAINNFNINVFHESCLGFLKENSNIRDLISADALNDFWHSQQKILFLKTNQYSLVHRHAMMDAICIKKYSGNKVLGVVVIIGFFASASYYEKIDDIPIIRYKIKNIMERYHKSNYEVKEVISFLQNYPRAELFQMTEDEIYDLILNIPIFSYTKIKVILRRDYYSNFLSVLILMQEHDLNYLYYNKIASFLTANIQGVISKRYIQISEDNLVKMHFIIKLTSQEEYSDKFLETEIIKIYNDWSNNLYNALTLITDNPQLLYNKYYNAFCNKYKLKFSMEDIVQDISVLMKEEEVIKFTLVNDQKWRVKLYTKHENAYEMIKIFDNLKFKILEINQYKIKNSSIYIYEYLIICGIKNISIHLLENITLKTFQGAIDNDIFNSLVYLGCTYNDILIIRTYYKYLKQLGILYNKNQIIQILYDNDTVLKDILEQFNIKWTQLQYNKINLLNIEHEFLTNMINCMNATKRFLIDNDIIILKIASSEIDFAPLPKPFMEIFVYGHNFEGIHLRNGKISRGGIRWSDRLNDYRTEILGLMKAQVTKNAIIIPDGAKGGFVVKHNADVVNSYKQFLRSLLLITDNIVNNNVIKPQCICYDNDDTYLVVAADKGTAAFSDYANAVSKEMNFWLHDAFASGGSSGYDHKKLGITAKGAWISVQEHFKQLNINPNQDIISVIGIGDMSGDVFGNGLLMSNSIKLIAAFNHMHIFIDPNPDPIISFNERQRLFQLPKSTWADYQCLSHGGQIIDRSVSKVEVSDEICQLFNLTNKTISPNALIVEILKAKVDLLWNGGIGTYVKAENETHYDIKDSANNAIRINGHELRCKVVGEGGNLGFTQLGRIEYAKNGGLINTDFIDNSAGVDCSDHEVNIKIAFADLIPHILTEAERNTILAYITQDVEKAVLNDNILQNHLLSRENPSNHLYKEWINILEQQGLNRDLEKLPSDKELKNQIHLTRPELCVIVSYTKNIIKKQLESINFLQDPQYQDILLSYFPSKLSIRYKEILCKHKLANAIIITVIVNDFVNTLGITAFYELNKTINNHKRIFDMFYKIKSTKNPTISDFTSI